MAVKNIKQKNIKVNQSGTNTSGQSPQQLQAAISGLSQISPNSPYGLILNQAANLMSGALQQQLQQQQQQSPVASGGAMGNVSWQLANLPFDSKLLVAQMPKYEEITQTKENEERPLNWDDIVNSQKQILDYNDQLKQLNAQNWMNYLQNKSGIEGQNAILRGLDEENSNIFQKHFAPLQKTGAYDYGYNPYGGLMDLKPAPPPPKFEKPIELKEIGKQTRMTEKTIKSGTDYSTQILSPQQQGTSTPSSHGTKQKMELLITDTAGKTFALGKEGDLVQITRNSAMNDPGSTPQNTEEITNQLFKYGGYSNFDANSKDPSVIDAFTKYIANAEIGGLNKQQWIDKIKKYGYTPKFATRDLVGAQLIGWLKKGNWGAVKEAVKGFFGNSPEKAEEAIKKALQNQKPGKESGYKFISELISYSPINQISDVKQRATSYLEATNTLAQSVGKTIFSNLGSLLSGYKDREYIPDYLKRSADNDIAAHLVRMSLY
jgi:hypothetical protein